MAIVNDSIIICTTQMEWRHSAQFKQHVSLMKFMVPCSKKKDEK